MIADIIAQQHGLALQAMERETIQELNTVLQNQHKCPTEKYGGPMVRLLTNLISIVSLHNAHSHASDAQTTQQEIGWFVGAYARNFRGQQSPAHPSIMRFEWLTNPRAARRQFGLKNNEITKYAEAYKITVSHLPHPHDRPAFSSDPTFSRHRPCPSSHVLRCAGGPQPLPRQAPDHVRILIILSLAPAPHTIDPPQLGSPITRSLSRIHALIMNDNPTLALPPSAGDPQG